MRLKSLDLIGATVVAAFTLAITVYGIFTGASGFPSWFLPFGILMVLFIPGYVLALAILPQLDRATILLLSLGISISMNIIGGLIINYTPWGLHPFAWAIWLSCISLLGCIIAAHRRSFLSKTESTRSATPRWNWKILGSFLLSTLLIVTAIIIARNSAIEAGTTFTQLWAIPGTNEDGLTIQIGIHNQESNTIHYELFAESQGAIINQWTDIVLAPGETWTMTMPLLEKPKYPITFLLYTADSLDKVYRTVHLVPASFNEIVSTPTGQ
jgi:uncharacterized membrane protein